METIQPRNHVSTKQSYSIVRIVLGFLLVLPALFCCLFQLLVPSVSTFLTSIQKMDLLGTRSAFVGLQNYTALFGNEGFRKAIGFTLLMLLARLLVVALVPPLLAWAVAHFGRRLRLALRTFFTLPIALFAPVVIAIIWLMFLNPLNGFAPFKGPWLGSPTGARSAVLLIDALYLSGLAGGLGLMAYLPLWRRSAGTAELTFREVWKPMRVIWALGILATIVLTLSTFSFNYVLTRGGPASSTTTLGISLYQSAFVRFSMGPAAAIATLILLLTALLGTLAGLMVVLSRLRLDLVDTKPAPGNAGETVSPRGSPVVPAIVVILALALCLLAALPFGWVVPRAFGKDGLGRLLDNLAVGTLLVNSIVPPFITAALQVAVAYLAALGIGALRPLGKRSEWLLLPFSPWLFITLLPLSLVNFMAYRKLEMLDTLVGSLSPIRLSIPALFILTLFFAGRAARSRDLTSFFKHVILPSLPLAALLWLLLLFFNGQDLVWPFLVAHSPDRFPVNLVLLQLLGSYGRDMGILAAAITFFVLPVMALFFLGLALFQVFYLDRLVLYSEGSSTGEAVPEQQ